jgi:predicted DNA-binding protein
MATFVKNFHIPLPEDLYQKLHQEAKRCKRPATELARKALEAWIKQRERQAVAEAIAEYAAQQTGKADLDKELEAASIELLMEENL